MSTNANDAAVRPVYSREATTERILKAAETLFAERGRGSVTVREVASEAGVAHGLVHRYLGSKSDLLRAVISRNEADYRQIVDASPDIRNAVDTLLFETFSRGMYSRMLVRCVMDGFSVEGDFETPRDLIALECRSIASGRRPMPACRAIDARVVVAAMVAMALGWNAMEEWLLENCDLEDADPAWVFGEFRKVILCVADFAFPASAEDWQI